MQYDVTAATANNTTSLMYDLVTESILGMLSD